MRRALIAAILAAALQAQTPSRSDLLRLSDELSSLVRKGQWREARAVSQKLRTSIEQARNESLASGGRGLTDSILTWLPENTESVIVANRPFAVPSSEALPAQGGLPLAQNFSLFLLGSVERKALLKALANRTVRLAVVGGRRFGQRMPTGLGLIPFEGCAAYALGEPFPETSLGRVNDETILGHRVWVSKGSANGKADTTTFLLSWLKPDLLLACNDRGFLTEMVTRMTTTSKTRALPEGLAEWKLVDRSVPFWGLTHYAPETKVLNWMMGPTAVKATGLGVEFGLAAGGLRARMLAKEDPWTGQMKSREWAGAATSRQTANGIWELTVSGKPEAAASALLVLMGALGFLAFI